MPLTRRSPTTLNHDVILEICEYVSLDVHGGHCRQYLRSLALVNRAFCEPALDVLWRELNGLLPLVQLLSISQHNRKFSKDILNYYIYGSDIEPNYILSLLDGPISDDQWARVQFYAPRVRMLSHHPDRPAIHPSIIYAMAHRALPDAILPGLHSLELTGQRLHEGDIMCFIATSLKHISFTIMGDHGHLMDTIFHRRDDVVRRHFLAAINARAPHVREIESYEYSFGKSLEDLRLFRYAQSIKLDEHLDHQILSQLAFLPCLKLLEFHLERIEHPAPFLNPGFLLLEELTVSIHSHNIWHTIHSLIAGIASPHLKKLKVETGPGYGSYFEPCGCKPLPLLLRRWESSMHELDFLIELCRISHSSCFITDYISPFLELSNLRIVNIYISHSKQPVISLSEGELISFADTWPQLEQMFIGFGSSYEHRLSNVATTPSINGLARLALKLPSLTYLSLPCTRLRQEDLWADVPPGSQHGLKELHISHVCPVNDRTLIAPVAEFLNFVFPSVTIYDDLRKAVVHE